MPGSLTYYEDKTTSGNAVAVLGEPRPDGMYEGFRSTRDRENSPVSWGVVPERALGERLTEAEARALHPRLVQTVAGEPVA